MEHLPLLTDAQWAELETLFPILVKRTRGKPHTPWRSVVNSILLVLCTKIKWGAIPANPQFATKSAAHRWFVIWEKNGFLNQLLDKLEINLGTKPAISLPPRRQRKPAQAVETTEIAVETPSLAIAE